MRWYGYIHKMRSGGHRCVLKYVGFGSSDHVASELAFSPFFLPFRMACFLDPWRHTQCIVHSRALYFHTHIEYHTKVTVCAGYVVLRLV